MTVKWHRRYMVGNFKNKAVGGPGEWRQMEIHLTDQNGRKEFSRLPTLANVSEKS